jgi:outer membrane protein assembly factor BamB
MNHSTPAFGSVSDSATTVPGLSPSKLSFWDKVFFGWVSFLLLAILVSQTLIRSVFEDSALPNMITMGAITALFIACATHPLLKKHWVPVWRFGPLVGLVLLFGVAALLIENIHFNNSMFPMPQWRWLERPAALEQDKKPSATQAVAVQDQRDPKFDYPQFLGIERRQIVRDVRLARDWKQKPPKEIWRKQVGDGWSGFAIAGWSAVTLEQLGDNETITCRDLKTGELIWTHSHLNVRHHVAPGGLGPRSTPTIDNGLVYTLGATGILDCLDLKSGALRWTIDILDGNPALIPEWGKACSPLIVGERVIVSAGADNGKSLHAYDKKSGKLLWTGGDHFSSYASPELQKLAGVSQILIVNQDFVDAHNPETGEVLWSFDWPGSSGSNANTAQAFALDDTRVFVSKHYFVGSAVFNVTRNEQGEWQASKNEVNGKTGWAKTVLRNKINNVCVLNGQAYGIDDTILQCVDLDTGKIRWKGGRHGAGQIILVGDLLLVQSETGNLILVEANPERYVEVAKFADVLHEEPCWNPPALAAPYLIMRNWKEAVCLELPLEEAADK